MDINEFLNRYYSTLRIAQEVDDNIDGNLFVDFADYEKKFAAVFFLRSDLLKNFIFLNDNGKVKLKPKDGMISDPVLKSIYENCKGAIDYIEMLVQMYYLKVAETSYEYVNIYLRHFFEVIERDSFHILSTPLVYGKRHDVVLNNNIKTYKLLAEVSFYQDTEVEFSDEEIELIIALASFKRKLKKASQSNTRSEDETCMNFYYSTFDELGYHSDLVDNIIENYPDIMEKLRVVARKTNNIDLYKAYNLLQEHKDKVTFGDIREVSDREKEKYVFQLNLEIANSNGRDIDAQEKLNRIKHKEQLRIEEERRKQRLNEVNKNIGTIKALLGSVTMQLNFNSYDVYMAQYIYDVTNGNYNELSQINPELYPHVQKPLRYLDQVTELIEEVNGTLTNDEIKYVLDNLFRNLNTGQLLTSITKILASYLWLVEPMFSKGQAPVTFGGDLSYDSGRAIGVYELPAFSVLVKQNPNFIQVLRENGVERFNGESDRRAYYLVENYINGQFLDEQKILTSYIDNDTFQRRQKIIKGFLRSEQSNRELTDDFAEEPVNENIFKIKRK